MLAQVYVGANGFITSALFSHRCNGTRVHGARAKRQRSHKERHAMKCLHVPIDIASSLKWSIKANRTVNTSFIGPQFPQATLTHACWYLRDTQSKKVWVRGALITLAMIQQVLKLALCMPCRHGVSLDQARRCTSKQQLE